MKKTLLLLVNLVLMTSCIKSKETSKIEGNDWLLGKWENNGTAGKLLETWKKKNDSIFIGESYFIKENDTLHSEKIELLQKGENLFYVSIIKGQNNNEPIKFKQNLELEKQLVFENPKNDYPRKIVYNNISKKRILIEVSGVQDHKLSSVQYSMMKTQ